MRKESTLLLLLYLFTIANGQDRFATDCLTPNKQVGLCIEIQDCSTLLDQVKLENTNSFEFIRASRCGPPNEDLSRPKVCCGSDINFTHKVPGQLLPDDQQGKTPTTQPPVSTLPPTNRTILPKICGKQEIFLGNRIFGGKEADVGEFPWLARLVHFNKYNRTLLGCSGFLIHRRFVLTAAHCIVGKGVEHLGLLESVLLGVHNDTKARICNDYGCTDPPRSVPTLRPIVHPGYDSNTHSHDIALIPLSERVNFTSFIRAICLPENATNVHMLTISGWGRTETDTSSRTKLKVDLPRANRSICAEKYKTLGLSITENQLCAGGESGNDSCAGDSGGPLMASQDNGLVWFAEGIVSYGNSCGREDWPGVYTNIPSYYNWIINNIRLANINRNTNETM